MYLDAFRCIYIVGNGKISYYFPHGGFKWLNKKKASEGHILEVALKYSDELHDYIMIIH